MRGLRPTPFYIVPSPPAQAAKACENVPDTTCCVFVTALDGRNIAMTTNAVGTRPEFAGLATAVQTLGVWQMSSHALFLWRPQVVRPFDVLRPSVHETFVGDKGVRHMRQGRCMHRPGL